MAWIIQMNWVTISFIRVRNCGSSLLVCRHSAVLWPARDQHRHRSARWALAARHRAGQRPQEVGPLRAEEGCVGGLSIDDESTVYISIDRRELWDERAPQSHDSDEAEATLVAAALRRQGNFFADILAPDDHDFFPRRTRNRTSSASSSTRTWRAASPNRSLPT